MEGLFALTKKRKRLAFIYLATLFLSFHYFLTVYVNSSLLSLYVGSQTLSILYIAGSFITIFALIFFTPLLRSFGNDRLLVILSAFELIAVLILAFIKDPIIISAAFILHQALPPLILFTLDIFLEATPHREKDTGGLRGIFLTITNIALVISPLLISLTAINNNFSRTYLLSAVFLIPLFAIGLSGLRRFHDPSYRPLHFLKTVRSFASERDLRGVFSANLLLQLFYAWMVVYTPLYLREIGLSWQEIGIIFSVMLLPFVLLELPIGRLSDRYFGEKEFMSGGFIILVVSTAIISFIKGPAILLWAILLFVTRVGASFIEITTESYFFKKVESREADLISFFRMTRPLSFVIGPGLGAVVISVFSFNYAFVVFALLLSLGIYFSFSLKDTR